MVMPVKIKSSAVPVLKPYEHGMAKVMSPLDVFDLGQLGLNVIIGGNGAIVKPKGMGDIDSVPNFVPAIHCLKVPTNPKREQVFHVGMTTSPLDADTTSKITRSIDMELSGLDVGESITHRGLTLTRVLTLSSAIKWKVKVTLPDSQSYFKITRQGRGFNFDYSGDVHPFYKKSDDSDTKPLTPFSLKVDGTSGTIVMRSVMPQENKAPRELARFALADTFAEFLQLNNITPD